MAHTPQTWRDLATQLRADSIRCTTAAGSGHPTSSMSAADLMAVLMCDYLHYDFNDPHNLLNDRLIFSKGHAAPLLYSMYKAYGAISDAEFLTLRQIGSRIEGHPVPILPYVDVATGSLGQGLPTAIGMAFSAKQLDKSDVKMWVLLGDSEMAEGSVYEALELGGFYGLDNIVAILDMNRLGQRGPTMLEWHSEVYAARVGAFGWHTIEIDGHDVEAINAAYQEALATQGKPTFIIAKTQKGAGVSFLADKENWHGKALPAADADKAYAELGNPKGDILITPLGRRAGTPANLGEATAYQPPQYQLGVKVATREAYGDALAALGSAKPPVVALDGEVSNSTFSDKFKKAHPERFFEVYIAEQQLVSAAIGLQVLGKVPFASTFAAFFSRAYDQIRMGAISRANIRLAGSHAGVSIGEDGASQMALEDLGMMRSVFGSTVLYPSCATTTAYLLGEMVNREGIVYMRTTREKTPILYSNDEQFPIGGSKVLRQSDQDVAAVIGAGITLHEALKAYEALAGEGTSVRVIDLYSIKPVDEATLKTAAQECGGNLIVVEDHWAPRSHENTVFDAFKPRRFVGALPTQVNTPTHDVREVLGATVRNQLIDE